MSLRPRSGAPPVPAPPPRAARAPARRGRAPRRPGPRPPPDNPARVARAAFPRGNPYLLLRERLGAVFQDGDFADLYPALGQPAYAPRRPAPATPPAVSRGSP